MNKVGEEKNKQNNKPAKIKSPAWAFVALAYILTLCVATGLVYYWRVAFMLAPALPAALFTLGIIALATLLFAAIFLACKFCKSLPQKGAVLLFVCGLLFVFANAPLQTPDETDHFKRAYALSMGRFNYDANREYPRDVDALVGAFEPGYNHKVAYANKEMVPKAFVNYETALSSGNTGAKQTEPIMFSSVPFAFPAIGMFFARLFGADALGAMYAGRIANLFAYAVLAFFTFKNCNKYRGVFMALAILPLSLFMAASNSYDALMLGACFYVISFFCKENIYTKDLIFMGIALCFAACVKLPCIVLLAIILLVPKARWKTKINPWLAAGAMLVFALLVWRISGYVNANVLAVNFNFAALGRGAAGQTGQVSPMQQVLLVLKNPLRFAAVAVLTFVENAGFVFGGKLAGLGTFGSLDLDLPLAGGLSVLAMASASALGIQQKEDTKLGGALGLFLAAGLYMGAVMFGLYAAHTNVASIRITGLQPRYFLPALLLLFMLLSILLGKAVRPRLSVSGETVLRTEQITLCIVCAVAIISAVLLFEGNFIGQWLPKSEGGWKLVNMFGWVQT